MIEPPLDHILNQHTILFVGSLSNNRDVKRYPILKMNKFYFIALIFGAVMACHTALAQSGWTRTKGGFFGKTDLSHLNATSYFTPSGTKLNTNAFRQTSLHLYAEYGIQNRLTLIASAPVLRFNSFSETETVAGQGDLRLELKYRLTPHDAIPIALSIASELPTGRRNAFAESRNTPGERINLPTGDGEWNFWTTLAASKSFGEWYFSSFGAYNFRTAYQGLRFRNLYQFGIEGGWNPVPKLWLNAKLRAQFSSGESRHPELGFVRGDGTTYTLASAEAFYKFNKNWGASLTYLTGGDWIAPLKNIYAAPYFSIGLIYEK